MSARDQPLICIGHLTPGTSLVDILYQLFDILTYQKYNPREDDSLNKAPVRGRARAEHRFPIDRRPLKRQVTPTGGEAVMRLASETAANAVRVLNKCSAELRPEGPWRWSCVVQNGARLAVAASLEDGFLQLALPPRNNSRDRMRTGARAQGNNTLAGGVKLALTPAAVACTCAPTSRF